jgi:hypothetical protein
MNLQEHIRRILKEESNIPSHIKRRIRFDYVDEIFQDSVDSIVKRFKRQKRLNSVINFKIEVITRMMSDLLPYLKRHIKTDDDVNGQTENIYDMFSEFLINYYDKQLRKIYKNEIEIEINEHL